jgi:hypothetical protein
MILEELIIPHLGKKSAHFMELESSLSLSNSQQLVPVRSHINKADALKAYFFKIYFNTYYPSIYA